MHERSGAPSLTVYIRGKVLLRVLPALRGRVDDDGDGGAGPLRPLRQLHARARLREPDRPPAARLADPEGGGSGRGARLSADAAPARGHRARPRAREGHGLEDAAQAGGAERDDRHGGDRRREGAALERGAYPRTGPRSTLSLSLGVRVSS